MNTERTAARTRKVSSALPRTKKKQSFFEDVTLEHDKKGISKKTGECEVFLIGVLKVKYKEKT